MARGLLTGGRGETEYSEDEDSDTEEYKSVKHLCVLFIHCFCPDSERIRLPLDIKLVLSACSSINPITGHVEEPMPNPIEEMTEEQKEYEGQNLVNLFDKLSR